MTPLPHLQCKLDLLNLTKMLATLLVAQQKLPTLKGATILHMKNKCPTKY